MVHALEQARRVLRPNGVLVDLRPDRVRARHESQGGLPLIYLTTDGETRLIGSVGKTESRLRSYAQADAAVDRALRRRWFRLEALERFPLANFFRSWEALEAHAAANWRTSFITHVTRARVVAALDDAAARGLAVVEPAQMTVLRRL